MAEPLPRVGAARMQGHEPGTLAAGRHRWCRRRACRRRPGLHQPVGNWCGDDVSSDHRNTTSVDLNRLPEDMEATRSVAESVLNGRGHWLQGV
ncbi:hypothetical protein ACLBOM_37790 [Escherichia coli]